ncbi:WD40 repeat domain-containing protein [Streptomyces otsuchiensis]|uniref:WD40 repeat domain-containing protein n=1 Tax=Streptomyces otsuchiensis TaxID=2681388 RepID=UPI00103251C0|nr:WD40 repeat domain-containing protein [Streptomyces otsuchiensis]
MAVRQLCEPGALDTRRPLAGRAAVPERVMSVAATRDLRRVAVATSAPWFPGLGELLLLEPDTRADPLRLPLVRGAHGAVVRDLVLSPDGSMLTASLGGAEEQHIAGMVHWSLEGAPGELWRRRAGRPTVTADGDARHVRLAVSADGSTVAGCDQNSHHVAAVRARSGAPLFDGESDAHRGGAVGGTGAVAVDADGSRLAFRLCRCHGGAPDGEIAVLGLRSGAFTTHTTGMGWCCGLAFSPDGTELAVVGISDDGRGVATVIDLTARPGDARPWSVLGELPWEARRQCARPVWNEHGPRVAVRSGHTVTVWDLARERPLHAVDGMGRETAWNLTPDGGVLVTATPDGLRAHPLDTPATTAGASRGDAGHRP